LFQEFARQSARAQKARTLAAQIDDGGFHADFARATVQDQVDTVAQSAADMLCRGGRDIPERVRTGGRDGQSNAAQQLQRHGLGGDPNAHRIQAGSDEIGDPWIAAAVPSWQDKGERAWPEPACELGRALVEDCPFHRGFRIRDMDDQGVEVRTVFGMEDARGGFGHVGSCAESVDGLGWKRHQASALEQIHG